MPLNSTELPAAICPITQEIMEDPVVCADGHSYERSAITQWLLARETSPCTNTPLAHRNVVPNYALRNLIAEVRGVRRPVTLEEHLAAAKPCSPEDHGEDSTGPACGTAPTVEEETNDGVCSLLAGTPRHDEETASAPAHAAEAAQPINPSKALCRRPVPEMKRKIKPSVGKNALHWAMVEGPQAEQRQLWLLLNTELAAQADQGGNLPIHYAASAGVSAAVVVACALAFMDGLEWVNKTGRTPLDIAQLEGHLGIAAVLEGMRNRHSNDLHIAFAAGGAEEEQQLQLLRCRPELAAQRDAEGNLPLHIAAVAGVPAQVVDECVRVFPDGPTTRNDEGFLAHQLALERGHAKLAEKLATHAGKPLPPKPVNSVLAKAARTSTTALVCTADASETTDPAATPAAEAT
mmetsp:Transcript_53656/g.116997  ORF Transcript_53656/g.116997 Transcript_53656/m.116997 type:complete len:406 (+) Transcript_53656:470-1687(+)